MSKHIPELTDRQLRNFWLKIDKRGPNDCWPWLGRRTPQGYGQFRLHPAGTFKATRVAYYLATGKQPGPLCVCHKCDNPGCCNPAHFFLGTRADNAADRDAKGRGWSPLLKGVDHWRAKLTEKQVLEIRASGAKQSVLAARYGVNQPAIHKIKTRKRWKHI